MTILHTINQLPERRLGAILVVLSAIGFSAKGIFIKLAYAEGTLQGVHVDAIELMALRMGMALPVFIIVGWWAHRRISQRTATAEQANGAGDVIGNETSQLNTRDWLAVIALGFFGYYLASYLDFEGLERISASLERLILYLYPSLVVLLSALLHRKAIRARQWQAMGLGYAGLLLVIYDPETFQQGPDGLSASWLLGIAMVFASALSFAVFLIGNGLLIQRLGSARFTAFTMSAASLFVGIHFAATHPLEKLIAFDSVWALNSIWFYAAMIALFSTILPAFLMNAGLRRLGATDAALWMTIGPVSTLLLANGLLGERMAALQWLGAALVLVSMTRIKSGSQ